MKNCVKIERAKIDITQEQLALAINVSRQTIHSIEKSKFIPSTVIALKIANFFHSTVEDILQLDITD